MKDNNQTPDLGMAKLFMGIAKFMPEEMLLDEVKKYIAIYEADKSDENRKQLEFYMKMAVIAFMHRDESIQEIMKGLEDLAAMVERDKIIKT